MRRDTLLLAALLAVASCEKLDFSEEEVSGGDVPVTIDIIGTGEGTMEKPYTVEDIQAGEMFGNTGESWVIGYVVGATYSSMKNATFGPYTYYSSNILLSSDSLCNDPAKCIPVELSSADVKRRFSLSENEKGFRKCLLVRGWPALYFKVNGLRSVSAGMWIQGYDLQGILRQNDGWDVDIYPMM